MLFYWEEELVRWRLLTDEEREVEATLSDNPGLSENERIHLQEELKILQARKRVLPSLRDQSGREQTSGAVLPRYQA